MSTANAPDQYEAELNKIRQEADKRVADAQRALHDATQANARFREGLKDGTYYSAEELAGIAGRDPKFARELVEFIGYKPDSAPASNVATAPESHDPWDGNDDIFIDGTDARADYIQSEGERSLRERARKRLAKDILSQLPEPDNSKLEEMQRTTEERIAQAMERAERAEKLASMASNAHFQQQLESNDSLRMQHDIYTRLNSQDMEQRKQAWSEIIDAVKQYKTGGNTPVAEESLAGASESQQPYGVAMRRNAADDLARLQQATEQPRNAPNPAQHTTSSRDVGSLIEAAIRDAAAEHGVSL